MCALQDSFKHWTAARRRIDYPIRPNPRRGNRNVAGEIFLHDMNINPRENDLAHGGKDYMGSEGCQGTCERGAISKITQGSEEGDKGTYVLMRPAEALDRVKDFVKGLFE